jgi:leucyl aminopeptidase
MKISVSSGHNINGTLIMPLFEGTESVPDAHAEGLHTALKSQMNMVLNDGDFKGKAKSTMSLMGTDGGKAMLIGLGKQDDADAHAFRKAGAAVIAQRKKSHGTDLTVRFSGASVDCMAAFAEGMMLRDYSFDRYKAEDEEKEDDLDVRVTCDAGQETELGTLIETLEGVTSGVHLSRDLGNMPPNDMYPEAFADQAWEWAKDYDNVTVTIINYDQAIKAGMGGLVAVGMGSSRKPCMVIFEMNADQKGRGPMLVGKGITFDTGGISLKPGNNMDEMKYDMGGSATVFGTMEALAATGFGGKVTAITCMAENMPAANAQRPGDVITTLSGKTIEVLNTDAEGRLVLSDGLWKAGEYDPEYIIDFATLTGACVVALGHEATGLWSNDDDFRTRIHEAGNAVDELAWPMPLLPAFEKEMTDSKIADTRNLGAGRYGGANTAAAFLKQFVPNRNYEKDGETIPWAHMDIAGTYWGAKTNTMVGNGATGVHVRTMYHLITNG